jgi:hypothetical protein
VDCHGQIEHSLPLFSNIANGIGHCDYQKLVIK